MTQNIENTYPNWLVPIEIAKKLKEIGFDEPCLITNHSYDDVEKQFITFNEDSCSNISVDISECVFKRNSDFDDAHNPCNVEIISVPTWEQVFQWFRYKFNLNVIIYTKDECVHRPNSFKQYDEIVRTFYYYEIHSISTEKCLAKSIYFYSYEEARYTAVKTISNKHIEENW